MAVAISAVSFVIWVHALGDHLPGLQFFTDKYASLALLIWTPLVAALYRGSEA
jgi:hypothetical protein